MGVRKRLFLSKIRSLREKHVDHLFDSLGETPKVMETPPERLAPLLARALQSVRKKITTLLEKQSNAPEEGLRKLLAQILT